MENKKKDISAQGPGTTVANLLSVIALSGLNRNDKSTDMAADYEQFNLAMSDPNFTPDCVNGVCSI